MASSVSEKWGPKEALGTANPSYPYIDFTWDASHEELTSPLIQIPVRGSLMTFMINTEAVNTATDATMTFKLKGAANPNGVYSIIYSPTAIANVALDSLTPELRYDLDSVSNKAYPYMKISMDPDANIASSKPIRVGLFTEEMRNA